MLRINILLKINMNTFCEINCFKAQFAKTKHLIPEKSFIYKGFNLIMIIL